MGLAGRLGEATSFLRTNSSTFLTETPKVGGVPRGESKRLGGTLVPCNPPAWRRCFRTRNSSGGWTAPGQSPHPASLVPLGSARGTVGSLPVALSQPASWSLRVSACARRLLAGLDFPRVASRGGPLRDRLMRVPSTSRRRGSSCPSLVHSCGVGTGHVLIWTRGHVLLAAAFNLEKVCAHLVGHFELLLLNRF